MTRCSGMWTRIHIWIWTQTDITLKVQLSQLMTSTFGYVSKCWCFSFHAALVWWNTQPNLYPHPCSAPARNLCMNGGDSASAQHLSNGDVELFLLTSTHFYFFFAKDGGGKMPKGATFCKGGNNLWKCFLFLLSINICTTYVYQFYTYWMSWLPLKDPGNYC